MSEKRMTSRLNTRSGAMMIDFGICQKPRGITASAPQNQIVFNVLDLFGERAEKAAGECSVYRPLIAGERQRNRVDEIDAAAGSHRLHVDGTHAQQRDLRRVEKG